MYVRDVGEVRYCDIPHSRFGKVMGTVRESGCGHVTKFSITNSRRLCVSTGVKTDERRRGGLNLGLDSCWNSAAECEEK